MSACAIPDFVVQKSNGAITVVEAKYGKGQLSGAQRALQSQIGSDFSIARTTSQDIANVFGGTASVFAGGGNRFSQCYWGRGGC